MPILLIMILAGLAFARSERDPVLDYYWQKGATAERANDPDSAGLSYVLSTRTFYHQVNTRGEIVKTDTVTADVTYTGGKLSSTRATSGDSDRVASIDLSYPNVFDANYHVSFFPNDTGGSEMPLDLIADSTAPDLPDGLVIIDRESGALKRLYLLYPNKPGYKRLSRTFWFVKKDGYVFPDSVSEVGVKLEFFSTETYRVETAVTDIKIEH